MQHPRYFDGRARARKVSLYSFSDIAFTGNVDIISQKFCGDVSEEFCPAYLKQYHIPPLP